MTDYEIRFFGFHHDTSAEDTNRLMRQFYGIKGEVFRDIGTREIRSALEQGSAVMIPVNAQYLGIYGQKAPPRHMIIVKGYTDSGFIINDPLIKNGANRVIVDEDLQRSLRDFPSGIYREVKEQKTAMIVIKR